MEPAPQWTGPVARSCAAVVAAVRSAGREAEAELFWEFLRQGGRPPAGSLPPSPAAAPAAAAQDVYEYAVVDQGGEGGQSGVAGESKGRDRKFIARRAAGFPAGAGLQSCSVGRGFAACVDARGAVLCAGANDNGQLGTGDRTPREGLTAARLPWPTAAVSCSRNCTVALRRGGREVWSWGPGDELPRGGDAVLPAAVGGLPAGDPVVLAEAGSDFVILVTASDAVYRWSRSDDDQLALWTDMGIEGWKELAPVRFPELSGRRIRRLVCGIMEALIETEACELLCWVSWDPAPRRIPAKGVAFPLRSMAGGTAYALADAAGRVWTSEYMDPGGPDPHAILLERAELPAELRAVRVALASSRKSRELNAAVCLTACGQLWDCTHRRACRRISRALPLGLLPYGGAEADRILLLPDPSCGRARLRVFARVAVRLRLPCDPLRVRVTRFAVDSCYLSDDEDDPFGWLTAEDCGSAVDRAHAAAGACAR